MLAALFRMIANRRLRNKGNLKEWQKLLPVITIALTEGWQKKKIFFMYKKRKNNHFYINALHRRVYKRAGVVRFQRLRPPLTVYPATRFWLLTWLNGAGRATGLQGGIVLSHIVH